MSTTISEVAGSDPDRLAAAAGRLQASMTRLQAQISAQQQALAQLAGGWQGAGANAALEHAGEDLIRQVELMVRLQRMQAALSTGGSQLSALRTQILSLAAQAVSLGGLAGDDGTVLPTGFGQLMTPAVAAAYTAILQALLRTFDDVDQATAGALDGAGATSGSSSDPSAQIPPDGTSAEAVDRWWDSLSKEQRDRLIAEHPDRIGNLNGVPVEARDAANQAVMQRDLDRVEQGAREAGVAPEAVVADPAAYGLTQTDVTRYTNARKVREGLDYNAEYDANGKARNKVFLHAYQPEAFGGQGRAAIAIGNPDAADNTTVMVPGTGNSVRDGYFTRPDGLDVYKETQKADRAKSNAVVMWMGYDAPDSPVDPRIAQTDLARQGGTLLAADVNAFEVTGDRDSHVTVIGHSYGSTTAADGAVYGMRADDVVLVGSPGTDLAKSAADFNLPEGGHVYVGSASTDPVTHLGGTQVPLNPLPLPTGPFDSPIPNAGIPVGLGADPAVDGFGSTRFKAEVPGFNVNPFHDHSQYFMPGSESLYAITDIASGNGALLEQHGMTARHRGEFIFSDSVDPELFRTPTTGHYH